MFRKHVCLKGHRGFESSRLRFMIFLIALATFCSTLLGGLFALRFKDKLHLILGFSAGAVIGVAFFDLLPEAINLGKGSYDTALITTVVAFGFIVYMVLDRLIFFHPHAVEDDNCHNEIHAGHSRLGVSTLSLHSFLDGLAIGLSFQVSLAIGVIVSAAVLTHDFSDGINTVALILKNHGSRKEAFRWLLADALAPVLGLLVSLLFKLSEASLSLVLAVFCGFFLYIGAAELLPESHHGHSTRLTTLMTILGVLVLYLVVKLAGA